MAHALDEIRTLINLRSAEACAALAEFLHWTNIGEAHLPTGSKRLTAMELHRRSRALHRRMIPVAERAGIAPGGVPARLRRDNTGCREDAAWLIEHVEVLAWAAGVRATLPTHDSRTEPGFSVALHVAWNGGLPPNLRLQRRQRTQLIRARAGLAAWWWRSRVQWYAKNFHSLAPSLRPQAKRVIKRRNEFIRLVAARGSARVCAGDLELSTGGPLDNNYFLDVELELKDLHRPRHQALQVVIGGIGSGQDATLATLWEEATGKKPDARGWPTTPI